MALRKSLLILAASAFAAPVFAAPPSLAINSPTSAQNLAQGTANPVVVTFTNSTAPTAVAAGFQFRLTYNTAAIAFPVLTGAQVVSVPGGIVCTQGAGFLNCGGFSSSGDFPATVTLTIGTQTLAGPATSPLTMSNFLAFDGVGDPIAGTTTGAAGTYTVSGGAVNTPPTIGYNPATGTTITYAGAGTASPIVATPSGGAGSGAAATTTVGACTITAGGAAFPTTNIAQLSFVGNTVAPQNIVLPNCVPQAAQVDATLTCPQSLGGAAATNQVWTLRCPAAAVGAVPPTLTYNPAPGSSNNVAAGAPLTIGVGCPTDGANCTGSGTGLAATSRLESLTATYAGPMFSPLPTMVCAFVTEGGVPTGGNTLDFVALGADAGDIRCTCPLNTTGLPTEPFTVVVGERSPASGGVVTNRSFTIVCGAPPPVCGTATYVNQAPGATINLTNGGAASPVSTVSLVGASNGVSQTISCATSNVSAGSTFTVTTNPTPLVISTNPALGGSISAGCTNTAETTGTATLTCTGTSTTQGCTSTTTFTLSCPGQAAPPPPSEFVPVPALNEQGRILLAALVLLMGLGVVGFRMRG